MVSGGPRQETLKYLILREEHPGTGNSPLTSLRSGTPMHQRTSPRTLSARPWWCRNGLTRGPIDGGAASTSKAPVDECRRSRASGGVSLTHSLGQVQLALSPFLHRPLHLSSLFHLIYRLTFGPHPLVLCILSSARSLHIHTAATFLKLQQPSHRSTHLSVISVSSFTPSPGSL